MGRPSVTIGASVLTTPVGIQAVVKRYVWALISANDTNCVVIDGLGVYRFATPEFLLVELHLLLLESVGRVGRSGTTARCYEFLRHISDRMFTCLVVNRFSIFVWRDLQFVSLSPPLADLCTRINLLLLRVYLWSWQIGLGAGG